MMGITRRPGVAGAVASHHEGGEDVWRITGSCSIVRSSSVASHKRRSGLELSSGEVEAFASPRGRSNLAFPAALGNCGACDCASRLPDKGFGDHGGQLPAAIDVCG